MVELSGIKNTENDTFDSWIKIPHFSKCSRGVSNLLITFRIGTVETGVKTDVKPLTFPKVDFSEVYSQGASYRIR